MENKTEKATPEDQAKFNALLAKWPVLMKTLDETKIGDLWGLYEWLDRMGASFSIKDIAMLKFCVAYAMVSGVVNDGWRVLED